MFNGLHSVYQPIKGQSRAITAENPQGLKGEGGKAVGILGQGRKGKAFIELKDGETYELMNVNGSGMINHIWITVPDRSETEFFVLRQLILRMYWDNEEEPSVEVPLGDFFCNAFGTKYNVTSLPIVVAPSGGMNCYFPMPFRKNARITITNDHGEDIFAFFYQINYMLTEEIPEEIEYFHAQFRRENPTQITKDYTLLDGVQGKGKFVGTNIGLTTLSRYWWGEGEVKVYLDGDEEWPTICGTGLEDYFGGAWGFVKKLDSGIVEEIQYHTPFLGYPYFSHRDHTIEAVFDGAACPMRSFYRWHIMDPILFNESIKITVQQIGHDDRKLFERSDDMCSVAYWYQTEPHNKFPNLPNRYERLPR